MGANPRLKIVANLTKFLDFSESFFGVTWNRLEERMEHLENLENLDVVQIVVVKPEEGTDPASDVQPWACCGDGPMDCRLDWG